MLDDYEFSRFVMLAVDAWRYGPRDDRQQIDLQHFLDEGLRAAARRSGLDDSTWLLQDAGDGRLALLPDSGAEPTLLDAFVRELDTWLARHNHDRVPDARLRLRIAIHDGPAIPAPMGYGGKAIVHVCRLRDANPVRATLDAIPEANLVLAVSDRLFDEVIRQRHTSLSVTDFTRAEIEDEKKDFTATAWLRVPGGVRPRDDAIVVGVRFLAQPRDIDRFVQRVLMPAFRSAQVALPAEPSVVDGLSIIRMPNTTPQTVLGVWIDHVDRLVHEEEPEARLVVSVCRTPDHARELASMETAARVLAGARAARVVIAVPDHFHEMIKKNPGRLVRPEAYARVGTSSWLRVPGHTTPPEPMDRQTCRPSTTPPVNTASVNASGEHGVAIGSGTFDTFVVGTLSRHDGADQ